MHWIAAILLSMVVITAAQDDKLERVPAANNPTIDVTVSESPVKVGENITIMCRIEGIEGEAQLWWTKSVGEGGRDNTDYISTSGTIKFPPYSGWPRYVLKNNEEGAVIYRYLYINGVMKEDSGNFYCGVLGTVNFTSENVRLDVYDDIDNVTIYVNDSKSDIIRSNEVSSPSVSVKCESVGGRPTPTMHLMVTDQNVAPHFNITQRWRYFYPGREPKYPKHSDRIITAYNATFKPSYKDNNKKLSCTAAVPGQGGFSPKGAEATIIVEYSPKFECSTTQKARLGTVNAVINCTVYANPPTNETYWTVHLGADPVMLSEGKTYQGITASRQSTGAPDINMHVLTISKVADAHFSSYRLKASNSLSSRDINIQLQKDTSPVGGASGPVTSLLATLLLTATAYMLH